MLSEGRNHAAGLLSESTDLYGQMLEYIELTETWFFSDHASVGWQKSMAEAPMKRLLKRSFLDQEKERIRTRIQDQDETQMRTITARFQGTRGDLLELSGYLCDTCWVSLTRIADDYPNLVFVPFVVSDDSDPSAPPGIAGGSLVFPALNAAGDKVLAVQGLNPTGVLLQAKMKDLLEEFFDYLATVAHRMGATAVVIPKDAHAMHTQTNRVLVHDYLKETYYESAQAMKLQPCTETSFNNYEMSECCIVIRDNASIESIGSTSSSNSSPLP